MPRIATTIHDAIALAATCEGQSLTPPVEATVQVDGMEAFGWVIHLPGLRFPVVFDTLTGLVAYHPFDNAFVPYGRIMRCILRYYDIRAALRRGDTIAPRRPAVRRRRRLPRAREVA